MAPKRKSEEEEPEAKKAKADVEDEGEFQEPDAPNESRALVKSSIAFHAADSTLNVLSTWGGKVLTPMTEAGMAYLIAGARANVGQKAGRYMFEVKIVQTIAPVWAGAKPKQTLRLGFSTSEAELVLVTEPEAESVFFDVDGSFSAGNIRQVVANGRVALARDVVIAVVLNLDSKSPNNNTIALYKDGVRVTAPRQIPEEMHGKTLYPHVNFRSVSVQVNMGPTPLKELPFKCRMLQAAAQADVAVAPSKESKDGIYEVVVPIAFPDEGTFDWLDDYLSKNPTYVELSDRKIVDWAKRSGLGAKQSALVSQNGSNDKPKTNFGIPAIDDFSVRKVINSVAPLVPRNYIVMEVKANLMRNEREELLKRFGYPCFRKVAHVVMGEPKKDFVERAQAKMLQEKQQRAEEQWKKRKEDKIKKELMRKRAEEIKRRRDEALKKTKKVDDAAEGEDEKKHDEEEKKEPETKNEEMEEELPVVELDEAEKKLKFRPTILPDLELTVLGSSFSKFSIPDDEERFDDIRYEWAAEKDAKTLLRDWILSKKSTMRIEDLKPGELFKTRAAEFSKLFAGWQATQAAYLKTAMAGADQSADSDIFGVEDVNDVKDGCPLFEHFSPEDWALVQLRFEFYLMLVAFPFDADDEDRKGILLDHLQFYYNKYYEKNLNPKTFCKETISEVLAMIADAVTVKDKVVTPMTTDELLAFDVFVRITEEQRRERQRRVDAGDETVRLKFNLGKVVAKPVGKQE
jgi:hypothetical protein